METTMTGEQDARVLRCVTGDRVLLSPESFQQYDGAYKAYLHLLETLKVNTPYIVVGLTHFQHCKGSPLNRHPGMWIRAQEQHFEKDVFLGPVAMVGWTIDRPNIIRVKHDPAYIERLAQQAKTTAEESLDVCGQTGCLHPPHHGRCYTIEQGHACRCQQFLPRIDAQHPQETVLEAAMRYQGAQGRRVSQTSIDQALQQGRIPGQAPALEWVASLQRGLTFHQLSS